MNRRVTERGWIAIDFGSENPGDSPSVLETYIHPSRRSTFDRSSNFYDNSALKVTRWRSIPEV